MHLLLQSLVIILPFISLTHESLTAYAQDQPAYTSVIARINKHIDHVPKPVYSVQIMNLFTWWERLLIDLDSPFTWHECTVCIPSETTYCPYAYTSPVGCEEDKCTEVRTRYAYNDLSCQPETNTSASDLVPAQYCTCQVNVVNPLTRSCSKGDLDYETFFSWSTSDGRNAFERDDGENVVNINPNTACAPSFDSFPPGVTGVAAFSTSRYALPFFLGLSLRKVISLCLPSNTSAPGVLFFGSGPYYFLPRSNEDVTTYLSYTPLLTRKDSFGYFITVTSITIKKRSINISTNVTNTNINITAKLSIMDPYTVLRTDIYNGVASRFRKVTKRVPPAKPVAPFGVCFNSSTTGYLKVPDIIFRLPNGNKWTVSTSNSIKRVTDEVACLAFVDGGPKSEPAIVIGSFQLEDNFLEFDLEKSILGFSSSLLRKKTSCSNFNITDSM